MNIDCYTCGNPVTLKLVSVRENACGPTFDTLAEMRAYRGPLDRTLEHWKATAESAVGHPDCSKDYIGHPDGDKGCE